MTSTKLSLKDLTKVYSTSKGNELAVDSISLDVQSKEFVSIVGPSGCGKSSTLRLIAGLETVTEGSIEITGEEIHHYGPSRRPIAMVFQNYALYNHMTAKENIGYGLKHSTNFSKGERYEKVQEMASLLEIEDLLDQKPPNMSGGQKQRVALGRALIRDPEIFLLDEPLSNLDAKLRSTMRAEIRRIHDELDMTTIYVTHNQKEAMTMADRIAVMNDGEFQQIADPETIYQRPVSTFVANFIGSPPTNIFEGSFVPTNDQLIIRIEGSQLSTLSSGRAPSVDTEIRGSIGIRPESLRLEAKEINEDSIEFKATIQSLEYQGNETHVHLTYQGIPLIAVTPPDVQISKGKEVSVSLSPDDLLLYGENNELLTPDSDSVVDVKNRNNTAGI